jgi:hypothetical protein
LTVNFRIADDPSKNTGSQSLSGKISSGSKALDWRYPFRSKRATADQRVILPGLRGSGSGKSEKKTEKERHSAKANCFI